MKVLFAVPYIYHKRYPEFTNNSTGFGMIMTQIYEQVAKNNDAYLISHVLTEGHGNILPHTVFSVIRYMRWKDLLQGIRWTLQYKQGVSGRLRYLFVCLNKGYIRHVIRQLQPDVVHINGVTLANKPYIEVCEELGVKYVVTLHGLIGLDDSEKTPIWNKSHEKEVLQHCEVRNIPVTVISTGIKQRIEKHYLGAPSRCITVVTNGTNVEPETGSAGMNLRKAYSIPDDAKIAIAVGNICPNKNQIQIVESMPLVCKKTKQELYVFLCGRDCTDGAVQKRIDQLGLSDRVISLGFVPHEQLGALYPQADFHILASANEGFGLGVIEGYVYGLPSVTFADLDGTPDLYDPSAMVLCNERSDGAFADALVQAMEKEWDKDAIVRYSKKFSLEQMAKNYLQVFQKTLDC